MIQRRAVEVLVCSLSLLIALLIAGCGGGSSSNKVGPPTTITVTPTTASLEFGRFVTLVASAKDANGKTVDPATITWSTSNQAVATVTSSGANGAVCAGNWDSLTAPTVCTPATTQANVTITAKSGSASASAVISVYPHIARLQVKDISSVACVSQTKTLQMDAQAFDNNNNLLPSTPGSFTWTVGDANIATVDANGLVTAKRPGKTTINASLTGTIGIPQTFTTCPPATILIGTQNVSPIETAFTLATGATKTVAAIVTDTQGNPITDMSLTFSSSNNSIASAPNAASTNLTATVTAGSPGTTTIVASCTPQSCNPGANQPYYSNPVTVTVSGTSNTKVFITGKTANGVVIIDGASPPSAPIALPTVNGKTPLPNSLVISPDGNIAYIGTDQGLLRFDLTNNTFLSTFTFPNRVLSVSQNGAKVLASDIAGTVFVYDTTNSTVQLFTASGVTAGDFSSDNLKALMVSGSNLHVYNSGASSLGKVPLANTATDLKFSPQSAVALSAESSSSELLANCTNSAMPTSPGNVGTILAKPNSSDRMWGADGSNIYQVDFSGNYATTSTTDCRPNITTTTTAVALGSSVSPLQLVATPNGQAAYLVSSSKLLAVKAGASTPTTIALAGGVTPLSAGIAPDSTNLFVGTSNNDIHRIDVASNTDVQQIPIGLKKADGTAAAPDLVAVRMR